MPVGSRYMYITGGAGGLLLETVASAGAVAAAPVGQTISRGLP